MFITYKLVLYEGIVICMDSTKDIEILKKELLQQAQELDEQIAEFHRWRLRHPIQYHKWLHSPEGKQYKLQQILQSYMCGL